MSKKLGFLMGIAVAVLLVGSTAMAEQDADVEGVWTLTLTIPMREGRTVTGALTLEVDGQDLKGTFQREGGDTSTEVTGKIEDSAISFTMVGMGGRPGGGGRPPGSAPPGGGRGGGMPFVFAGTVDGDAMSGEFEIGDRGSGDWSAKRAG